MQENLYAIIGKDLFLVENEVDKIIENLNVEPFNIITYDLEEEQLEVLLQELTTVSLLSDEKVIKVRNPWFFHEQRNEDLSQLVKYFRNPKEDTVLIFMLTEEMNSSLLVSKEAKKYIRFEIVEEIGEQQLPEYVKEYFNKKGYKIEAAAISELLSRVDSNYQLLKSLI
jgi:DNA polymerase-3 subunit delta